MPSNRLLALLLHAICVLPLAAQNSMVAPLGYASIEGSANDHFLIGRTNLGRIMDVYGEDQLPAAIRAAAVIQSISLRADGRRPGQEYFGKRVFLSVQVSTTQLGPRAIDKEFDAFHGTDRALVADLSIAFPYQAPATAAPRAFNVVIPFSQPWYYNLSPRRGSGEAKGLVIDYRMVNKWQTGTSYNLDCVGFCQSSNTQFGLGANCISSRGQVLGISASTSTYGGGKLLVTLDKVIPKYTSFLGISAGPLGSQTPVEIAPQTGCYLNFQSLFFQSQPGDANGYARYAFPVPRDPMLVGLPLHFQGAVWDINSAAGYYTSLGLTTSVCGPADVAQLSHLSDMNAAQAGSNVYGLAHVLRFN